MLQAIRLDQARPTVNARTLFHMAIAMYDAWAAYDFTNGDPHSSTYFLGHTLGSYNCPFSGMQKPTDIEGARNEAISYAAYTLLYSKFANVGSLDKSKQRNLFDSLFLLLHYDKSYTSIDYQNGKPADLGNYLGQHLIKFGKQDGSNEANNYKNNFYKPVNPSLIVDSVNNFTSVNPNRWQPIQFTKGCLDQNGFPCAPIQSFLGAEWGNVVPFALQNSDLKFFTKGSDVYPVYNDPGQPPQIALDGSGLSNEFIWSFTTVLAWSSHLDPADGKMIDISPAASGNIPIASYPLTFQGHRNFYNQMEGGDIGSGYSLNPKTGQPYQHQIVPRGDYTRVLAEFWADGPNSETPPGHWFTILNNVNDKLTEKKWRGKGPLLSDLEWDVKSYLTLGGALHDAAVSAWGIKGYYDGIRPVSAIRFLADKGQSSDISKARYSPAGLPLIQGLIELVQIGDPLAGHGNKNVNKIKINTWRGPKYITNPKADVAGVGWILAEEWYPYQRPSFVTPPFAGYISGHSTFSSTGAEVLTLITGDEYFPGGLGEFPAPKWVFEKGPTVDFKLQWARYKDAADQSALSRIWGGIHPPFDDMPGRFIGKSVGDVAVTFAESLFAGSLINGIPDESQNISVYPNPVNQNDGLSIANLQDNTSVKVEIFDVLGREQSTVVITKVTKDLLPLNNSSLEPGLYIVRITANNKSQQFKIIVK